MKLNKKPQTGEKVYIFLYHFCCEIENFPGNFDSFEHKNHKVCWINIEKVNKEKTAPNIAFLIEKEDLE